MTDREMRRAKAWLSRHGLWGIEPFPLLAARLAVRRRASAALIAVLVVAAVVAIEALDRLGANDAGVDPRAAWQRLIALIALMLVAGLARWLWQFAVRRGEQRLAATLTRRAAHPTATDWRAVLRRRGIASAALLYGGALGFAIAIAVGARTAYDLAMAGVLLLALVAVAAMTAFEVAGILRRPALAEDAGSLVVDDVLRADDARTVAVSPVPAVLAVFTVMSISAQTAAPLYPFCYAFVGVAFAVSVWSEAAAGFATGRRSPVVRS
ncbi:MAG TPA: hypothetical protein VFR67_01295 [Pilimelia sp.]|nr:hypothetical protein [Pilimelia sp.]